MIVVNKFSKKQLIGKILYRMLIFAVLQFFTWLFFSGKSEDALYKFIKDYVRFFVNCIIAFAPLIAYYYAVKKYEKGIYPNILLRISYFFQSNSGNDLCLVIFLAMIVSMPLVDGMEPTPQVEVLILSAYIVLILSFILLRMWFYKAVARHREKFGVAFAKFVAFSPAVLFVLYVLQYRVKNATPLPKEKLITEGFSLILLLLGAFLLINVTGLLFLVTYQLTNSKKAKERYYLIRRTYDREFFERTYALGVIELPEDIEARKEEEHG